LKPGIVDQIRQATNGIFPLGNSRFKEEIAAMLGRRVTPNASGEEER
jgi:putative transposase